MKTLEPCDHNGLRALPGIIEEELRLHVITRNGRFRGEFNLTLWEGDVKVAVIKVFCGRSPYKGWIEVFDVDKVSFPRFEDALYNIAYEILEPGESIYVDYSWDWETMRLIDIGAPAIVTRLGFKLFKAGFTWFKVWYYPEGFMEGNVKIQAEKPLDESSRLRHTSSLCDEIKMFTSRWHGLRLDVPGLGDALERAFTLEGMMGCRG